MDQASWNVHADVATAYRPGAAVRSRPLHEGVGNALRAAFTRPTGDLGLPIDIRNLLEQIN